MNSLLKKVSLIILCGLFSYNMTAQEETDIELFYGITGGLHSSHIRFSDIDGDFFPTNENLKSGMFSFFVQGEFHDQKSLAVRAQMSFLKRGGKLTEIYKRSYGGTIEDINYTLKTNYFDMRVPVIYNFGEAASIVRPYVYVAPVIGIATGGEIKMQEDYKTLDYSGYEVEVSKANMASAYIAGQIGAGVKFAVPFAGSRYYLGLEANYELGLTDTYGKGEKDGHANDVVKLFTNKYQINGTRKFSGFEIQAVLQIPICPPKPTPMVIEEVVVEEPEPEPEPKVEQPCYTLEEIIALMEQNESVEGKTICAVDAIRFDLSQSVIKPESYDYLDKLATTLIQTNNHIEVKGHTDDTGTDDFNMTLSRERAEAVVEYLVTRGVNRNKLTYSYYGKTRPLAPNTTEEGRTMNRRVEFTISSLQ